MNIRKRGPQELFGISNWEYALLFDDTKIEFFPYEKKLVLKYFKLHYSGRHVTLYTPGNSYQGEQAAKLGMESL